MQDEMGEKLFVEFLKTHLLKRSWETLIQNDSTVWWDDVNTKKVETRADILVKSYQQTIEQLSKEFGADIEGWKWEKVHKLKHNHAFASIALLDKFFSVGTFKMLGGNKVLNNTGHRLYTNEKGEYEITFGPAMRTVIDFADIENSMSVIPTGQSGFPLSPHYDDQTELYNTLRRRKQMMNREEIVRVGKKVGFEVDGGKREKKKEERGKSGGRQRQGGRRIVLFVKLPSEWSFLTLGVVRKKLAFIILL